MFGGGPNFHIFNFRGIPVSITLFGLLIIGFYTFSMSGLALASGSALVIGLGIGVGIMLSILLHEMAHALAGTLLGATVSGIQLNLLGGVTYFSYRPPSYIKDIIISLAGPATNFALWKLFELGGQAFTISPSSGSANILNFQSNYQWMLIFYVLSSVNFFLAVFNALPCYPLDGGQAAFAFISKLTGNPKFAAGLVLLTSWGLIAYILFSGAFGGIGILTIFLAVWIAMSSYQLFQQVSGWHRPVRMSTPAEQAKKDQAAKERHSKAHKGWQSFEKGRAFLVTKDYQQAIDAFSKALEVEPKESLYWDFRAYTFAEMGLYAQSLADYNELLKKETKRADYFVSRAKVQQKLGNIPAAMADVTEALKINSADGQALELKRTLAVG